MKLSLKNPKQAKSCSLVVTTIALAAMADSNAAADSARVFNKTVSGVPAANPEIITFGDDRDTILVTEDRGDTLHDQLNKLDSIWAYKLNQHHPERSIAARFVALGLDNLAGVPGEEDNEPTGVHMSERDSTIRGLIGTRNSEKIERCCSPRSNTAKTTCSTCFPST